MKIEKHEIDILAEIIRKVDGMHSLGASSLAEAIYEENKKRLHWGCAVDLEPDQIPDGCVIDTGKYNLCVYAKEGMCKGDCEYWQQYDPADYGKGIG